MYNEPLDDEDEEPMGLRSRFGYWVKQLTGRIEEEEEYEDQVATQTMRPMTATMPLPTFQTAPNVQAQHTAPRRDTFRIATSRESSITVMPVTTFGDVQKAADRLKAGEPQIVNLEKTSPEVAERLIDFLNGVTYALDGYVEKVADSAYLFTPSHIAIHADGPEPPAPKPFFDRL
jgi:cell division inhibitor SepF